MSGATSLPTLIGSDVTAENVGRLMRIADGVIIGSSLKRGGVWWQPVEQDRVAAFVEVFAAARSGPT